MTAERRVRAYPNALNVVGIRRHHTETMMATVMPMTEITASA
jgi:hypothetical protein